MKLAEALILRADHQKKIHELRQRLNRSAQVQEGEEAPENPRELLQEASARIGELTGLIQRINSTNSATACGEHQNISDALAHRDALLLERSVLSNLIESARVDSNRYSRSEIRFISTVNIAELQRDVDRLSQEHRILDSQIQALNWQVDLLDG